MLAGIGCSGAFSANILGMIHQTGEVIEFLSDLRLFPIAERFGHISNTLQPLL